MVFIIVIIVIYICIGLFVFRWNVCVWSFEDKEYIGNSFNKILLILRRMGFWRYWYDLLNVYINKFDV